jgi:transcriptional regulator with XRE-family HTH domain
VSVEDRDKTIGQNLLRLRGERSQKELADAMRARGFKWSQATVWSIEKGERPLRLAEAEALGTVLDGAPVEELLRLPLTYLFYAQETAYEGTWGELQLALGKWGVRLYRYALMADEVVELDGVDELRGLMSDLHEAAMDDPEKFFALEFERVISEIRDAMAAGLKDAAKGRRTFTDLPKVGPMESALMSSLDE